MATPVQPSPATARQYHPRHAGPQTETHLTGRQRIILAGLGALVPIVLNLLVVDLGTVFSSATAITIATWTFRVLVLFALGAITGWMHQQEHDRVKIFQLGIVAPALLTSLANGTNVEKHGREAPGSKPSPVSQTGAIDLGSLFVSTAWAQEGEVVYSFTKPPEESVRAQVVRGLTGKVTGGNWFACVRPSFASEREARDFANRIASRLRMTARVYAPSGGPNQGYVVAVSDWVSEPDASAKAQELRKQGIDAYAWSPTLARAQTPSTFWVFLGQRVSAPNAQITGSSFRLPATPQLSTITPIGETRGRDAVPKYMFGDWVMGSPVSVVQRGQDVRVVALDSVPAALPSGVRGYWIWAKVEPAIKVGAR